MSTTRGRQYTGSAELFDGPEVQILENRASLPVHESTAIAHQDLDTVPKKPVGDRGRDLLEKNEVDPLSRCALEPRHKLADISRGEARVGKETDGDVDIAPGMRVRARERTEKQCIDTGIAFQHSASAL
ncbi:MAG TPA: hypothetical protein VIG29_09100 [Vicinamibacteria bacterium]